MHSTPAIGAAARGFRANAQRAAGPTRARNAAASATVASSPAISAFMTGMPKIPRALSAWRARHRTSASRQPGPTETAARTNPVTALPRPSSPPRSLSMLALPLQSTVFRPAVAPSLSYRAFSHQPPRRQSRSTDISAGTVPNFPKTARGRKRPRQTPRVRGPRSAAIRRFAARSPIAVMRGRGARRLDGSVYASGPNRPQSQ